MLKQIITDFYAVNSLQKVAQILPTNWQNKLAFRQEPSIPTERVSCLWGNTLIEHTRHYLGFSPAATFAWLDQSFAYAAASQAQRTKSNLLLYTPYAWEAFRTPYRHNPHKILFEYHSHREFETQLLTQDIKLFPFVKQSYQEQTGNYLSSPQKVRVRDCWKHADLILCASSFTQNTLLAAGAEPKSCKVEWH